jgi:hypothetical protein
MIDVLQMTDGGERRESHRMIWWSMVDSFEVGRCFVTPYNSE